MSLVPEISYANTDPDRVLNDVMTGVESNLGRSLYPGDPLRLFALAFAAEDVQIRNLLDEAGRQNLVAYATGDNLDALGALVGVARLTAQGSTCTLRFTAGSIAVAPLSIPAGTRATPDGVLYWATDYATVIPTGQLYVDVPATCASAGPTGNGYIVAEINQIVDPVAFVPNVSNITPSSGGTDIEADEAFRTRIRLGVTAFSVAGPRDAYAYWARTASGQISDVYVLSPTPGAVDVYVLLQGGELPGVEILGDVQDILRADNVRPLTDLVTAKAPTAFAYTLNITYCLRTSDAARASEIRTAIQQAIDGWVLWQRSAIGRDLNPSELVSRVMQAGARRVLVTSPAYTAIPNTSVAALSGTGTITYGGLEDD